jgi:hypothetical protein
MNMSRKTEEGGYGSAEDGGWPDETPREEGTAVTEETAQAAVPPTFFAIEEHAKARQISAPVFAAVRQMKGWSEGKKVEEAEFNEAVNAFLNAPAGASAPIGGKE